MKTKLSEAYATFKYRLISTDRSKTDRSRGVSNNSTGDNDSNHHSNWPPHRAKRKEAYNCHRSSVIYQLTPKLGPNNLQLKIKYQISIKNTSDKKHANHLLKTLLFVGLFAHLSNANNQTTSNHIVPNADNSLLISQPEYPVPALPAADAIQRPSLQPYHQISSTINKTSYLDLESNHHTSAPKLSFDESSDAVEIRRTGRHLAPTEHAIAPLGVPVPSNDANKPPADVIFQPPPIVPMNSIQIIRPVRPINRVPAPVIQARALATSPSRTNRYQAQPSHNNYPHQQHHSHERPVLRNNQSPPLRYRGGPAGSRWSRNNIYKRVLLCDKTLISLDYLRKQHPPTTSKWAHEIAMDAPDFEWDENNNIDLDSSFDDFYHPNLANGSNFGTRNAPSSPENYNRSMTRRMSRSSQPEWLLPDEDPLVLCDMWDLEKGLLNRKPPEQLLGMAIKTDFNTVREAIKRCRQLSERTIPMMDGNEYRDAVEISTEDMVSMFSIKRGLIPGTKWCGLGDIAATYNDLGQKRRIDICCRAHDHCPIRLKPFRNDYGLFNIALYTKSHCECDADFYRCLREVRSKTADMLGNLYFNVMKLQCLREEPMKMCREIRPIALGFERCVKYEESLNKTVFRFSAPPQPY